MASERRIRFGPAGNSASFYEQGHKRSDEIPRWLNELGLDAYEYSFGRGVRLTESLAGSMRDESRKFDVALSVHAPYYINLANPSEETRIKSRKYLFDSAKMASVMGATRVIFHAGSSAGQDRAEALKLAMMELELVLAGLQEQGLGEMILCPETMGRPTQLGTLDEVLALCRLGSNVYPAIDFGHINALEQGSLKTADDFRRIVDSIGARLGSEKCDGFHAHFSHIQYGNKGEIKHLTFEDHDYGPEFDPLAQVLCERGLHPVIICESRDVMAEDALRMKAIYAALSC